MPRTEGAHLLATLGGGIEERVNPDGDMTLLQLEGDFRMVSGSRDGTQTLNLSARRSPAFIIPGTTIGVFSNGFPSVRSFPTRDLELSR